MVENFDTNLSYGQGSVVEMHIIRIGNTVTLVAG